MTEGSPRRSFWTDVVGTHVLGYTVAALLLGSLVWAAGIWSVLANTRLLKVFIESGIVRLHDMHLGVADGLPDPEMYLLAIDPVDWYLVGVVIVLYCGFWTLKAFQFHGIAKAVGMTGSLGDHAKAFFYGSGLNILWPFKLGNAGAVASCVGHGEEQSKASTAVYTQELFVLFEIAVFAILGLVLNGWTTWFGELFWGVVILGIAYWVVSPAQDSDTLIPGRAPEGAWKQVMSSLSDRPSVFLRLALLSLLAFLIDDFTPYLVSQAFTQEWVIMNVSFSVIQMGVVAGYIARQVPVTPGGIGQFEWGFAAALYMGGVGMPEAATIALLESAVRHGTGLMFFTAVVLWKDSKTEIGEVLPLTLAAAGAEGGES